MRVKTGPYYFTAIHPSYKPVAELFDSRGLVAAWGGGERRLSYRSFVIILRDYPLFETLGPENELWDHCKLSPGHQSLFLLIVILFKELEQLESFFFRFRISNTE